MKAIVCTKYGPPEVLQLQDREKPMPRDHEVLIRVHSATVTAGDCGLRSLAFPLPVQLFIRIVFGFRRPRKKILGQELSGEIEAIGKAVTRFKQGDQVFAWAGLGAYAEYACLPENGALVIKPSNTTYEETATLAVCGLDVAYLLRRGKIQSGQKVLINGAGGSMGTFAVQLAKCLGAEVTAVDSTEKLDMLRAIGADQVIDYTQEDFSKNGQTYDVIFDVTGAKTFLQGGRSLKENGRYLLANPRLSQQILGRRNGKQVIAWKARSTSEYTEDFNFIKAFLEAGKIRPVIDRRYPLEQIAEAHRYAESGQKKGNIVITV
ncbi:NADPH:quinone reductase [Reticulibacter mediterranei]|uniref:NADPH:quinone reductase n=2 Tax=Reticulibacter mediterranei TaxID=2778369 RepID=A0A8J3IRF7_9CHLR|nr:NADPH:quinone reductase [Reticulibacter mediterranei]